MEFGALTVNIGETEMQAYLFLPQKKKIYVLSRSVGSSSYSTIPTSQLSSINSNLKTIDDETCGD